MPLHEANRHRRELGRELDLFMTRVDRVKSTNRGCAPSYQRLLISAGVQERNAAMQW